mgnify:CR=1 FL=1|tara:strand:- start:127 stop:828 length:702 start_codon:yes stop_codon:yes gene_type:complete
MAGEIQLNSVSLATESSSAITLGSAVSLNSAAYASTSEVQGTHTTFSGSHSDTATTINLASVSGISVGDYVVGEGITLGTTVSSVGASSVVISAGLDTDSVGIAGGESISFYKADKVLSPGLVASGLCRAWVNFDGTGTVAIRASFNVSSIEDLGTGLYRVTFLTAMPDINYCVQATCGNNRNASSTNRSIGVSGTGDNTFESNMNTTDFRLSIMNSNASDLDHDVVCAAVFR